MIQGRKVGRWLGAELPQHIRIISVLPEDVCDGRPGLAFRQAGEPEFEPLSVLALMVDHLIAEVVLTRHERERYFLSWPL